MSSRRTPTRAGAACVLLLALASALPAAASRLHLHNPAIRRLEGKATVLTIDTPNTITPQTWLNVKTDYGENVLILGDAALAATTVESGSRVSLEGAWMSRGAGAVRVFSGTPVAKSQYCFVGATINTTTPGPGAATAASAQAVAYGPAQPVMGQVTPATRRLAAAAPLGRPGGPAADETVEAREQEPLLPRDAAGQPIASAAWVGLGPDGVELPAAARRRLAQVVVKPPPAKFVSNPLITSLMKTIIIPISANESTGAICPGTQPPRGCPKAPCTAAQLKKVLFQSTTLGGNSTADTVGRAFEKCSFGKTKFDSGTTVAEMVNIPCSGITNDVSWTFTKCDFDDFNGYADKADEVMASRGVNMDLYHYAVYLIPPGGCKWVGLGYVGCDGTWRCRVWISGDFWTTAQALVHELQHNMYQGHAGAVLPDSRFDEYGDSTCSMGHCCSTRCPNVVHGWQMGWYPVQQVDPEHLPPGTTLAFKLNPATTLPKAGVQQGIRFNMTWSPTIKDPLFIGYRVNASGTPDVTLPAHTVQKVHLYTSPIKHTWDPSFTTYKASLAFKAGCTNVSTATTPACWWQTDDVVIRVNQSSSLGATVTLCRKVAGGKETKDTCLRKVDGDCNGRVNTSDAACATLVKAQTAAAVASMPLIKRADMLPPPTTTMTTTTAAGSVAALQPGAPAGGPAATGAAASAAVLPDAVVQPGAAAAAGTNPSTQEEPGSVETPGNKKPGA